MRALEEKLEKSLTASKQECRLLEARLLSLTQDAGRKEQQIEEQHRRDLGALKLQLDEKVEKQVGKRKRELDAKERLFKSTVTKLMSAEEVCVPPSVEVVDASAKRLPSTPAFL